MRIGRGGLWAVLLCVLLIAGCIQAPVMHELTIEPSKSDDTMIVTVETTFQLDPQNDEARRRVEAARAAALASTDEWSVRFASLRPVEERLSYQRRRGTLERMLRSAQIPSDDLQDVLSDANITVDVLRGEGWSELAFYPGTSGRASREQVKRFDTELEAWSRAVARYFVAIDRLYTYMRDVPGRERYFFAAIMDLDEEGTANMVTEDEQPLVDAVMASMNEIAERLNTQEDRAATFAEEADLIFNPFPARIVVDVPTEIVSAEGFTDRRGNTVIIERIDLFAVLQSLEGKWISPDPMAAILQETPPTADQLAAMPRTSTPTVHTSDVAAAIREQLARPGAYRVRWRE